MRTALAAVLLFALTACSTAQEKKDEKNDTKSRLKVGDPAPPLAVTKWLKGDEIKSFAPGKVYVVDFWATWCGPCIASMPHLNELQAEFKDQGLIAVAVTTKDKRGNNEESVENFVKTRGAKYNFGFAFTDNDALDEAYMQASGQEGIPCSFVIDKAGKLAFIGHPMDLDEVLPKVLAGTWRGKADNDEFQKVSLDFQTILEKADKDAEGAVVALEEFGKKNPARAKQPLFPVVRIKLLIMAKKFDEAKTATEAAVKTFIEKKDTMWLSDLKQTWMSEDLNPDRKHVGLAVTAAEGVLAIEGDKDAVALYGVASAQFAAGQKEKAVAFAEKALAVAEEPKLKAFLEKQVKKFKGE